MSLMRVTRPSLSAATTVSPNCSGSDSRPSVCTAIWNAPGGLVDRPSGNRDVGGPQCIQHVGRRKTPRLQLCRIEPDPHGVVAGAEDLRIADTVETRENVF